jgi:dolichyl-phosphate beta-glucosyltransferase
VATAWLTSCFISINNAVELLRHDANQGKGRAVRSGMLRARGAYRLFMDADNSTSIAHWPLVERCLGEGYDIVIGSRQVSGSVITAPQGPLRDALGLIYRLIVKAPFSLGVRDTQNGFKGFSAQSAEAVFSRQRTRGWAFDVEVLTRARKLGFQMKEIPVTWVNDGRSKVTVSGMVRMLFDLMAIRVISLFWSDSATIVP